MSFSELLRITDRTPMVVEVKNGHRQWKPRFLYILGTRHPRYWYTKFRNPESMIPQLERRVDLIVKWNGLLDFTFEKVCLKPVCDHPQDHKLEAWEEDERRDITIEQIEEAYGYINPVHML